MPLSMTIVKCHVQCLKADPETQNTTICMHYACRKIEPEAIAAVAGVAATAGEAAAGQILWQLRAPVKSCKLSQKCHKTFTIYHAFLRTLLATFGACIWVWICFCWGNCLTASSERCPCSMLLLLQLLCETRNLHMYLAPRQQQQ